MDVLGCLMLSTILMNILVLSKKQTNSVVSVLENSLCFDILRLEYPSFLYLKFCFQICLKEFIVCLIFTMKFSFLLKIIKPLIYQSLTKTFELIHSDVWGTSKVVTHNDKLWFMTFIDDHTRLSWIYLLTNFFEVNDTFKCFYNVIEIQFQTKISMHFDNEIEYFNNYLSEFVKDKCIVH